MRLFYSFCAASVAARKSSLDCNDDQWMRRGKCLDMLDWAKENSIVPKLVIRNTRIPLFQLWVKTGDWTADPSTNVERFFDRLQLTFKNAIAHASKKEIRNGVVCLNKPTEIKMKAIEDMMISDYNDYDPYDPYDQEYLSEEYDSEYDSGFVYYDHMYGGDYPSVRAGGRKRPKRKGKKKKKRRTTTKKTTSTTTTTTTTTLQTIVTSLRSTTKEATDQDALLETFQPSLPIEPDITLTPVEMDGPDGKIFQIEDEGFSDKVLNENSVSRMEPTQDSENGDSEDLMEDEENSINQRTHEKSLRIEHSIFYLENMNVLLFKNSKGCNQRRKVQDMIDRFSRKMANVCKRGKRCKQLAFRPYTHDGPTLEIADYLQSATLNYDYEDYHQEYEEITGIEVVPMLGKD